MKIAVDFDGTIVENNYPDIGKPMHMAFEVLKELKSKGHKLILWTYRDGDKLNEAVEFCKANGITFFAINHSFPEEADEYKFYYNKISRKIDADIFIDDRNIGGFIGWDEVMKYIHPDEDIERFRHPHAHFNYPEDRKNWIQKIFRS